MKHLMKTTALLLCLCLVLGMMPAALALEPDTTVTAALSQTSLQTSTEAQTVELYITADQSIDISGIGGQLVWEEGLTLTALSRGADLSAFTVGDANLDNGIFSWIAEDSENRTAQNLVKATFTIPGNTPAGTYTLGFQNLELSADYGDTIVTPANAAVTLTITGQTSGEVVTPPSYTAALTCANLAPVHGEVFTVSINATHTTETVYAAAELSLSYSTTSLRLRQDLLDPSYANLINVNEEAGTISLADYGADKNLGEGIYVLSFETISAGEAQVLLTGAALVNKADAEKQDLIGAHLDPEHTRVNLNVLYSVTLPDGFEGLNTAVPGQSYTFQVPSLLYNYTITATMGGENVNVIDNGGGSYTIENVTGNLVITSAATPRVFAVTIVGPTAQNDGATATYTQDYHFTLPEDVAAGLNPGVTYGVGSIKIGDKDVPYSIEGRKVTIAGTEIVGDLTITITETPVEPNTFTVTVTGSGASDAENNYAKTVGIHEDYSLNVTQIKGYDYIMTVTMGGVEVTPIVVEDEEHGHTVYTVANVTGNLEFALQKRVNTDGVELGKYLTLGDGHHMWLITKRAELADGNMPTYSGQPMFWSDKYQAYCYLVVSTTLTLEEAKLSVNIQTGTAAHVDYGMDVNMTGTVDASDAQLVYNMYQTGFYTDFTADVPMEKYLRADVDGNLAVNVDDAADIIYHILYER